MNGTEGGSGGQIEINNQDLSGKHKDKMLILQARAKSTMAHTEPAIQRGDSSRIDGGPSYTIGGPYQYQAYQQPMQMEKPSSRKQKKVSIIRIKGGIEQQFHWDDGAK